MSVMTMSGDLIALAKTGVFDVIAHGCNCFCTMGAGIAKPMALTFKCNDPRYYSLEDPVFQKGNINKLGQVEAYLHDIGGGKGLYVANCYTQYRYDLETKPFDIEAFTLCMRKLNKYYHGLHFGLPKIGSHLAGGDWEQNLAIIEREITNNVVTIVEFNG